MRSIWTPLITLILMGCCHEQKMDPSVLIATDKAFSQMSVEKGLSAANDPGTVSAGGFLHISNEQ